MTDTNLPASVDLAQTTQAPVTIGFTDGKSFELAQRVGNMFSKSSLVPREFQNNIGNCAIAINMAARIGADPLMVMQNLYLVHGRPGWSSQFLIATFNNNPNFSALRYEFRGEENSDEWACRAYAYEKGNDDPLKGAWISIGLAKKEGWYSKSGSKWQSMPEQMLRYRAASWFIRAYAPEIAMGLQTAEELKETVDLEPDGSGTYSANSAPTANDLNAKLAAESEQTKDVTPEEPTESEQPIDYEAQLGDEYAALSAADRKKTLTAWLHEYDVNDNDMEKLVGKSYGQWAKKDRQTLAKAFLDLQGGADPADVFA